MANDPDPSATLDYPAGCSVPADPPDPSAPHPPPSALRTPQSPLSPVSVTIETSLREKFALARRYHEMARLSMSQSVAFMILCGAEIHRLWRELGFSHGGKRARATLQGANVGPLTIEVMAERYAGISRRSAFRYRAMAEAARKRIPQLDSELLLNTPLGQLPELRQRALLDAVHKVTDGETAQQLMWDWGIAKPPQGAAATGGWMGVPKRKLTPEEESAALRALSLRDAKALADSAAQFGSKYMLLENDHAANLADLLATIATAIRSWLATPAHQRDPHQAEAELKRALCP